MVKFSSFKNRVFNSQEPTHEIRLVVVKKDLSRTLALGFIVVYNIFALILCTTVAHHASWGDYEDAGLRENLYFFYCTVPCVASVYSIIEFILDWCGKLKPLQPLITAPIFVVGYVLSFVFQSTRAFCYNDDMDANIQCVYHLAGLDYWYEAKNSTGTLASSIGGVGIGGAVIYLIYFFCTAVFMRHSRQSRAMTPTKPADNESAYSFSTMPASTTYVSPTPPSYRYSHSQPGPSRHTSRLSKTSDYSQEEVPRKM